MKTATKDHLTERQIEVVRLIARCFTVAEIGQALDISPRTAKAHCDVLRQKLGVDRTRDIPAAYARIHGDDPYPRLGAAA